MYSGVFLTCKLEQMIFPQSEKGINSYNRTEISLWQLKMNLIRYGRINAKL